MPQLSLQQTSPELQVLRPQVTALVVVCCTLQLNVEQVPPGGVQMPQLALQHT